MTFYDWLSNTNNPKLQPKEYLFGTRHIIMISITILAVIVLSIIFYKKSEKAKKILLTVLISILLFFEITSRIVNFVITSDFSWQNIFKIIMPLHICSVAVIVVIIAYFTKNKTLLSFATIVGLLATFGFLIYPAVGINQKYIAFTNLYSIVSHMTGFIVASLFINLGFVQFKFQDIWKTYLCFAIMFAWGALVDFVILPNSDYMYLRNDPLELNLGFPYHILYLIIISIYISAYYLIYYIIQQVKLKHNKK